MNKGQKRIILFYAINELLHLNILMKMLKKKQKKQKRRWWVKRHLHPSLRNIYGAYNHLFVYFALNDAQEFYDFMHLSLDHYITLLTFVRQKLVKHSRRPPLSPDVRLAVVLHFLAHGGCPKSASWTFRIGKSTIYPLIPEVCRVIAQELVHRYVQFPNRKKWLNIAEDFQLNSHFPNCLGALDGKHIRVEKPANAGATCKNYKKFHSLVLMAMCDSKRRFTWFNFGDFGSYSDSSILIASDLHSKLERNDADIPPPRKLPNSEIQTNFVIVCDEIFGISKHIMKPYGRRKDLSKEEKIFNYRLSRARISIECAFGIITEKWQILQSSLRFSLPNCDTIICALIGLHNFVLFHDDPDDNHAIIEDYPTVEERNDATAYNYEKPS